MTQRLALFLLLLLVSEARAVSKPHVLSFGKWATVSWSVESDKPLVLKVRPLYVDGKTKEFTFGLPHEVTDRLFVVRQAFRINDALPDEPAAAPRWEWQPGGWLLVDRVSGHVSQIALPEFDPYYSAASWYRDYIAYCGISDDGKKISGVVSQLGRRKVVLKKTIEEVGTGLSGADCFTPVWQRKPSRVTFRLKDAQAATYMIHGHAAEMIEAPNDEEEADKATE